jgi:hypothetical protein
MKTGRIRSTAFLVFFCFVLAAPAGATDHEEIARKDFGVENIVMPEIECWSKSKWDEYIARLEKINAVKKSRNIIGLYVPEGPGKIILRHGYCWDESVIAHEAGHHLYYQLRPERRNSAFSALCREIENRVCPDLEIFLSAELQKTRHDICSDLEIFLNNMPQEGRGELFAQMYECYVVGYLEKEGGK